MFDGLIFIGIIIIFVLVFGKWMIKNIKDIHNKNL